MSTWQGRGMSSGPGGGKPRLAPIVFASMIAFLLFNALTGRIDLTRAFDDDGVIIVSLMEQRASMEATVSAQEAERRQQQAPIIATTTPAAGGTEAQALLASGCEPSGDDRFCLYTVQPGDSLASIATRFGLDGGHIPGWELLFESNRPNLVGLDEPLQPGAVLRVPASIGVLHLVLPGDSVSRLAEDYGITTAEITEANALSDPDNVQIGDILFIPDPTEVPTPELDVFEQEPAEDEAGSLEEDEADGDSSEQADEQDEDGATGDQNDGSDEDEEQPDQGPPEPDDPTRMSWPVTQLKITNYMSARHPLGMDFGLGAAPRSPIMAAAGGTVIFAGGDACCSYGYYVIVDHGGGLQSLYAHLRSISVKKGDGVGRGQTLGIAGNTGNSRGVHLHFEVYKDGRRVDPMRYLPAN